MLYFGDSLYEAELRMVAFMETDGHRLAGPSVAQGVAKQHSAWAEQGRRLMAWLGCLMVDWGCELQNRYAAESSTTLS
jgi:hypothetical protein